LRRLAGTAGTWTTRRHAAHKAPNQVAVTCGSSRARRGGPCPDTPPGTRAAESLLRETRVQNLATLRGGARVDVSDCRVAQVLIWLSRAWPGQWASTFPWRPVRPALRSAPTRLARPSASIARPAPVPSTAAGCRGQVRAEDRFPLVKSKQQHDTSRNAAGGWPGPWHFRKHVRGHFGTDERFVGRLLTSPGFKKAFLESVVPPLGLPVGGLGVESLRVSRGGFGYALRPAFTELLSPSENCRSRSGLCLRTRHLTSSG
jgi:hypothetical protein